MTQQELIRLFDGTGYHVEPKGKHSCKVFVPGTVAITRQQCLMAVAAVISNRTIQYIHSDGSVVVYN